MKGHLNWNKNWNLGVVEMDEAHQSIAAKLDRLFCLCQDHQERLTHRTSLTRISEHLFFELWEHLHKEEELMVETGYPHEKEHLMEHYRLLEVFRHFLREVRCEREHFDLGVLRSLRSWFINHLDDDDRALSQHILKYRRQLGTKRQGEKTPPFLGDLRAH
jgi:hemerythrin-like metal-binding protein